MSQCSQGSHVQFSTRPLGGGGAPRGRGACSVQEAEHRCIIILSTKKKKTFLLSSHRFQPTYSDIRPFNLFGFNHIFYSLNGKRVLRFVLTSILYCKQMEKFNRVYDG